MRARALAKVAAAEAAIVRDAGNHGPYRASGDRAVVARVPAEPTALFASHGRAIRQAGAASVLGVAALAITASSLPARIHADRADVPLAPLLRCVRDREAAAPLRRARAAPRGVDRRDRRPLPPLRSRRRRADAARATLRPGEHDLVVVVTDHDMYLRTMEWHWAFAHRRDRVAVVSVARMDPAFRWLGASTYRPERPECGVDLLARAHKMITRQILFAAYRAEPLADPRSARRSSVLSLQDLDAIDERAY